MEQRTSHDSSRRGLHVAIIMDGNGRWALRQGLPRVVGHRAGVAAVRRAVAAAPGLGINALTLFAFTAGNWERPPHEVAALMQIFRDFFRSHKASCVDHGIRVNVIGRRDRLEAELLAAIEQIEAETSLAEAMHLRIAVDYSARDAVVRAIVRAASRLNSPAEISPYEFARLLAEATHAGGVTPDVDLLIRTGGEQRLSDCLLWESAYAELVFSPRMWPDFDATDLEAAVREFYARDRRFGRLPEEELSEALLADHRQHSENIALPTP